MEGPVLDKETPTCYKVHRKGPDTMKKTQNNDENYYISIPQPPKWFGGIVRFVVWYFVTYFIFSVLFLGWIIIYGIIQAMKQ
jgi:cell division septal protein FtsQ